MTVRPRSVAALATAVAVGAAAVVPRPAASQVTVTPPRGEAVRGDTLRSVTPTFLVQAVNVGPARPLRVVFQIANTPEFRVPLAFDTLITTLDSTLTVAPTRALDQQSRIYWRAQVIDPSGAAVSSSVGGPLIVPNWVTPVSPAGASGVVVRTRRPVFVWRSPQVAEPPGPWEYTIEVRTLGGERLLTATRRDTTYQVPEAARLEANASYTWRITARLVRSGQATIAVNPAAFTIEDPAVPTATLLYQNFPNPFPTPFARSTCVWFDLGNAARVELDVYDLRGLHVRRLLPNAALPGVLPPGRYGRAAAESNEGCAGDFAWDGRADDGRIVPAGVYLLRFRSDGVEAVRKMLFRGP